MDIKKLQRALDNGDEQAVRRTLDEGSLGHHFLVSDEGLAFLRAYADASDVNVAELLYMLEKPWKFQSEYVAWVAFDRPQDDDPKFEVWAERLP
jgi:hypothetical protein